ncbi:hypothetical protein F4677DRAFT_67840 [Hypoxylon crocopeplum]|nr:hypothetical protein F4677DRAFT_67840 [Hypoxylon crocopeplum]
MISWHAKMCAKADIVLAGRAPFCVNCEHIAPSDIKTVPTPGPLVSPNSRRGNLNLAWPSSVVYTTERIPREDEAGTYLVPRQPDHVSESNFEQRDACLSQADPSKEQESDHGYESLSVGDNIRLLRLGKGVWDDPLHGTLVSAPLGDRTGYEAVSYVWADEEGIARAADFFFLESIGQFFQSQRTAKALFADYGYQSTTVSCGLMQFVLIKVIRSKGHIRSGRCIGSIRPQKDA